MQPNLIAWYKYSVDVTILSTCRQLFQLHHNKLTYKGQLFCTLIVVVQYSNILRYIIFVKSRAPKAKLIPLVTAIRSTNWDKNRLFNGYCYIVFVIAYLGLYKHCSCYGVAT